MAAAPSRGGGDTQDYIGVPLPLLFVLLPFILKSFFQKGILSPSPYFSTSSPPELMYANTWRQMFTSQIKKLGGDKTDLKDAGFMFVQIELLFQVKVSPNVTSFEK